MMDLDALKIGLNRKLEEAPEGSGIPVMQSSQKSGTLLHKLRRNIRIEMIIYLVSAIGLMIMAFTEKGKVLRIYSGTFSIPLLLMVPVFLALDKTITRHLRNSSPISSSTTELLDILKTYSMRYVQFSTLMSTVCLLTMVFLLKTYPPEGDSVNTPLFSSSTSRLLFFLTLFLFTTSCYFISKVYVKWLYGDHIRELEQLLREFQDK
jgi:hypothetical protein